LYYHIGQVITQTLNGTNRREFQILQSYH